MWNVTAIRGVSTPDNPFWYYLLLSKSFYYRTIMSSVFLQHITIVTVHQWLTIAHVWLTSFSPVLRFIQKPVTWYAEENKWLVSIWNVTLGWNGLTPFITLALFCIKKVTLDLLALHILENVTKIRPLKWHPISTGNYVFKVNNRNKVSNVFKVNNNDNRMTPMGTNNFEHISYFVLMFLLLTLSR